MLMQGEFRMKKNWAQFLSAAIFAIISASSSFAMGPSASGTAGNNIPIIGNTAIQLNPYIMVLQKEFQAATKPITSADNSIIVATGNGIVVGQRYNCRVFPALTNGTTQATQPSTTSWYQFQTFGGLFIDNEAYMDGAKIKTFASNPQLDNEVWGQSQDETYYEAIRLTTNRDLIIEGFAPAASWVQIALGLINVNGSGQAIEQQLQNMQITTSVAGIQGYIVSYSYCPISELAASSAAKH
jgi:hypothetical protein